MTQNLNTKYILYLYIILFSNFLVANERNEKKYYLKQVIYNFFLLIAHHIV